MGGRGGWKMGKPLRRILKKVEIIWHQNDPNIIIK